MVNIIIFGPPGSGKGTQAVQLAQKYNLIHISTGDLLREEIANGTSLGLDAKLYIDSGKLVPDKVMIDIINIKLEENKQVQGFIFDGFPRTVPQAEALDNLLNQKGMTISKVLALDVSVEELKKRILKRGMTSGRSDDTDELIIDKRVKEYEEKTKAAANYFDRQEKLSLVQGEGTIEDTFALLCEVIDK